MADQARVIHFKKIIDLSERIVYVLYNIGAAHLQSAA
jgi:hypothetical protein